MKRCPSCNRTYTDLSLNFCLEDGTPLTSATTPIDPNATIRYPQPRDTRDPPATEIYNPQGALANQVREMSPPPTSPAPPPRTGPSTVPSASPPPHFYAGPGQVHPKKKSGAVWWIFGGLAVFAIIGVGIVIMILAIASMSGDSNSNRASNTNTRTSNRNSSTDVSDNNSNSTTDLPSSVTDDFSEPRWGSGTSQYGDIWYVDDEYHMRSKAKTYLVMYGPSNQYSTENATVRVTVRSVDGTATTSGYGLIVHGEKTKSNQLEDYALLIYTGEEPQYEVVMHKNGNQTALIPWTRSSVIRSGTNPNQLEARIKGEEISFYINGQYVNRITDTANFKRGLVGFYASDTAEIAFDDLEVSR